MWHGGRLGGPDLQQNNNASVLVVPTESVLALSAAGLRHARGFRTLCAGVGTECPAEKAMVARQAAEGTDEHGSEKT
jgi:hypothetical protein